MQFVGQNWVDIVLNEFKFGTEISRSIPTDQNNNKNSGLYSGSIFQNCNIYIYI